MSKKCYMTAAITVGEGEDIQSVQAPERNLSNGVSNPRVVNSIDSSSNMSADGASDMGADSASNMSADGAGNMGADGAGNMSADGAGNMSADGAGNMSADGAGNMGADGAGNMGADSAGNMGADSADSGSDIDTDNSIGSDVIEGGTSGDEEEELHSVDQHMVNVGNNGVIAVEPQSSICFR
ncbi:MSCRAMM family adhesin SdrC [Ehrlichia chaffeensis]|uniref:MSCRAMM family adhesin SdrC n=1 Tax=Ehrlichia chaffeensis TaxID=945 RepID=UPI001E402AC9|nr:MSCRAMM family adhesin SdrC [Ehrlichia chaffeensis]